MKRMVVVAMTLLASAAAVQAQNVERKFDKFQDYTSFEVAESAAWHESRGDKIGLEAFYTCPGDVRVCSPRVVSLLFSQSGDDWNYLHDHTFVFLLDGKTRLDMGERGYEGRVGNGYVLEFQTLHITPQQLKLIAKSSKVEAQWGSMEFELSDKSLKGIRALSAALPSAAGGQ